MKAHWMLTLLLCLSFFFLSCGRKEPAQEMKLNHSESSSLSLSPRGVSDIQKLFDLY